MASPLSLYNFLTRKKEVFRPINKKWVGLYTCGPTVYDYAHIGNFRTYIFEDIVRRTLVANRFTVKHVMNITDVDDKTIRNAREARKPLAKFTKEYTKYFFQDLKTLNILPAWQYPRATDHVRQMIALIQQLLKSGLAYQASDGIYFAIAKFPRYGKLSQLKLRSTKNKARIQNDEYAKHEAHDFALWKMKREGEPSWKAPFGEGRPGWHIECSAMAMKYLGNTFDIHAGGIDLLFPHHEDEIAQSEGATGKPFVRYFLEGEHLMVDGKKMSKSLGNTYTLRDLSSHSFGPIDFRYFVLGAHYRKPLNFTWQGLRAAQKASHNIVSAIERLHKIKSNGTLKNKNEVIKVVSEFEKRFHAVMNDDINTPQALAVLNRLAHYAHASLDKNILTKRSARIMLVTIFSFDSVLGLNLKKQNTRSVPHNIALLIKEREKLREEKKWNEADALRAQLSTHGWNIEDTSTGPVAKKKR